jgi:hypothetical protein
MRVLFSSVSIVATLAACLISSAQASPIYEEASPFARTDNFAIRLGSASLGLNVIAGYRSIDGKNFYHDDSSPKLSNSAGPFGFFTPTGESGSDARPLSFNSFGSLSSSRGGVGSPGSFGGGGNEGVSLGFGGAQTGFGVGSGSSLKGLNPLELAYTNLGTDRGGFPALGEAGGSVGKVETSATPLPPAWTLMLIGLAGFGYAAFRLRSRSAGLIAA